MIIRMILQYKLLRDNDNDLNIKQVNKFCKKYTNMLQNTSSLSPEKGTGTNEKRAKEST